MTAISGGQAEVLVDLDSYEPPAVLATFDKDDLSAELPENLTPHIHAVQDS